MDEVDITKLIDHTELKPDSPYGRYTDLCREALQYQFHSVCVNSFYVPLVKNFLIGFGHSTSIKVCSVIGFPLGASNILAKITDANDAISNGATEIDAVINIGALKTGDTKRVRDELKCLRDIVKDNILKIILEVGLLTEEETKLGCDLCIDTGCDFVKTSTGFNIKLTGDQTIYHTQLLKKYTKNTNVKIKASAGIRTLKTVKRLIDIGVDRIGTSQSVKIIQELQGEKNDK